MTNTDGPPPSSSPEEESTAVKGSEGGDGGTKPAILAVAISVPLLLLLIIICTVKFCTCCPRASQSSAKTLGVRGGGAGDTNFVENPTYAVPNIPKQKRATQWEVDQTGGDGGGGGGGAPDDGGVGARRTATEDAYAVVAGTVTADGAGNVTYDGVESLRGLVSSANGKCETTGSARFHHKCARKSTRALTLCQHSL